MELTGSGFGTEGMSCLGTFFLELAFFGFRLLEVAFFVFGVLDVLCLGIWSAERVAESTPPEPREI